MATPPPGRSRTPKSGELLSSYVADRAHAWLHRDLKRTRAGLANSAGLTPERVHDFLDGTRRPTQRTLRALSKALGTNFGDLESAAGDWLAEQRRQKRGKSPRAVRAQRSKTPASVEKYPNRAKALEAAKTIDHDPRDIAAVLEVVLPPGSPDPSARTWLVWVDRARTERLHLEENRT